MARPPIVNIAELTSEQTSILDDASEQSYQAEAPSIEGISDDAIVSISPTGAIALIFRNKASFQYYGALLNQGFTNHAHFFNLDHSENPQTRSDEITKTRDGHHREQKYESSKNLYVLLINYKHSGDNIPPSYYFNDSRQIIIDFASDNQAKTFAKIFSGLSKTQNIGKIEGSKLFLDKDINLGSIHAISATSDLYEKKGQLGFSGEDGISLTLKNPSKDISAAAAASEASATSSGKSEGASFLRKLLSSKATAQTTSGPAAAAATSTQFSQTALPPLDETPRIITALAKSLQEAVSLKSNAWGGRISIFAQDFDFVKNRDTGILYFTPLNISEAGRYQISLSPTKGLIIIDRNQPIKCFGIGSNPIPNSGPLHSFNLIEDEAMKKILKDVERGYFELQNAGAMQVQASQAALTTSAPTAPVTPSTLPAARIHRALPLATMAFIITPDNLDQKALGALYEAMERTQLSGTFFNEDKSKATAIFFKKDGDAFKGGLAFTDNHDFQLAQQCTMKLTKLATGEYNLEHANFTEKNFDSAIRLIADQLSVNLDRGAQFAAAQPRR